MTQRTGLLAAALLVFAGCSQGADAGLRVVAIESDGDLHVEMLAEAPLRVGWNRVYYRLTDEVDGEPVTQAHITQQPVMRMEDGHTHGGPSVDPMSTADDQGRFAAQIVFTMPSDEGTWNHELVVQWPTTDTTHELTFEDLAVEPGMQQGVPLGDPASADALLVTLTFLEEPRTGLVPFVLTAHERAAPFDFPPRGDLDVTVTPFMPAHGHGSTGSEDPTHTGDGMYEGAVNFNMPGWWTLDFHIEGLETLQFEITF